MELRGTQRQELLAALLAAFPTLGDLTEMVRYGLDIALAEVVPTGGSLREVVFNLNQWAEARGRLADLVEAALAANPGNPQLKILAAAFAPEAALRVEYVACLRARY